MDNTAKQHILSTSSCLTPNRKHPSKNQHTLPPPPITILFQLTKKIKKEITLLAVRFAPIPQRQV